MRLPVEEIDGDLYRLRTAMLNHAHLMAETMEGHARTASRLLRRPDPMPRPHDELMHAG